MLLVFTVFYTGTNSEFCYINPHLQTVDTVVTLQPGFG